MMHFVFKMMNSVRNVPENQNCGGDCVFTANNNLKYKCQPFLEFSVKDCRENGELPLKMIIFH